MSLRSIRATALQHLEGLRATSRGEVIAAQCAPIEPTRYCRPLVDSLPLLPDGALPDAPPLWPRRAPVEEPAPILPWPELAPALPWPDVPALPWPEEPWRTFAPAPAFPRVVLEVPTVVELPLRTWVRVDTPPPTATPVRRLLTMTVLEGSL